MRRSDLDLLLLVGKMIVILLAAVGTVYQICGR